MSDSQYFTLMASVWVGVSYAASAAGSWIGESVGVVVVALCLATPYIKAWQGRRDKRSPTKGSSNA